MNFDKKRRARVQGGWAATGKPNNSKPSSAAGEKSRPASGASNRTVFPTNTNKATSENDDEQLTPCQTHARIHSARSENGGRLKAAQMPVWVGKNIDKNNQSKKFVYEEPDEVVRFKPVDQVITKPGVFDISTEPSGASRLRYFPDFISPSRSEAIFAELFSEIPWIQRHDIHSGEKAMQPRLTAWYGDVPYFYAGVKVEANTAVWPKALTELKHQLAEVTGLEFNSLAANLYRTNHDSIGWHCDDEPIFGKTPIIASLSFGEERNFELRKIPLPEPSGERDYTYSQVVRVPIHSGALLIMEGWTQTDWQHRVPKEYHDRGARINVTFRIVSPIEEL